MVLRLILFFVFYVISSSVWAVTAADYYQAGNAFYHQGQWEKAAQYYRAALQADPVMWEAQMGLGNADYRLGKLEEALRAYDQSLANHPDNPSLKAFADKLRLQVPNAAPTASPGDSWTSPPAGLPPSNNPSADSSALQGLTAAATPEWKMDNKLARMSGLPKAGKFAFGAGSSAVLSGSQDIKDFYGPTLTSVDMSYGGDLYLGADYTLIPNLQIGLQVQGLYKVPKLFEYSFTGDTELWREFAIGGAVVGKGLLPISSNINLILHLEGGMYTLVASALEWDHYYYGEVGTINLDASGFGGLVGLELEILQNVSGTWALDLGLGYRFLSFSPLKISGTISGYAPLSGNLKDWNGNDSRADFSGIRFSAGVRFY